MPFLLSKLLPLGAALAACGPSSVSWMGSVGLANAPAATNATVGAGRPDDVIANGRDSCARDGSGGSPLRGGTSSCARVERASGHERAFVPRIRSPLAMPHMPCWLASDPWPVRATPAAFASCNLICPPTLVECNTQ